MKVKVLIENSGKDEQLSFEHGLSLYIEFKDRQKDRKILMDFGASQHFEDNAKKMGVDLSQVDMAVLSHGHYDHGGGMNTFFQVNTKAKVYVSRYAFGDYYSLTQAIESVKTWDPIKNPSKYIGIDKNLELHGQLVYTDDEQIIDEHIVLYSNVSGDRFNPTGNKRLLMKNPPGQEYDHDRFSHEQNMIIYEGNHTILFAGCAHKGIVNIIEAAKSRFGAKVTHVVSGLHLYNKKSNLHESQEFVRGIADYFIENDIRVYTGHCTGDKAFRQLREVMGENILPMYTGMEFTI